jgi:tetratricopeptide (TPR) repeat protein
MGLVLVSRQANAQAPDADRAPALSAQALFDEAIELMQVSRFREACGKLQESFDKEPAGGTLLNLGYCYEQSGRSASAHATYLRAIEFARRDGRTDREVIAQGRVTALASRLAYIRLVFGSEQVTTGLTLELDGAATSVPRGEQTLPVDPGEHKLRIALDPTHDWETSFVAPVPGATLALRVPLLVREAERPRAIPLPDRPRHDGQEEASTRTTYLRRTFGLGLIAGAGVTFLAGAGFGVATLVTHDAALGYCAPSGCEPRANTLEEHANAYGWATNVLLGTAVLSGVTGVVLLWLHGETKR